MRNRPANYIPPRRPFRPLPPRRVAPLPALDGTRAEPPGGLSREQWIKALLKAGYRGAGSTPINSDESSATGRCLHPHFTDQLDVLQWVAAPYLTARQIAIVESIYRDDLFVREVAQRLHLHHSTVSRERHDALEVICRIFWHDPGYAMPWRVYTRSEAPAEAWRD